jgi:hypothetical protein
MAEPTKIVEHDFVEETANRQYLLIRPMRGGGPNA